MISHSTADTIAREIANVILTKISQAPLEDKQSLLKRLLLPSLSSTLSSSASTSTSSPTILSASSFPFTTTELNIKNEQNKLLVQEEQDHIFDMLLTKYKPVATRFVDTVNYRLATPIKSSSSSSSSPTLSSASSSSLTTTKLNIENEQNKLLVQEEQDHIFDMLYSKYEPVASRFVDTVSSTLTTPDTVNSELLATPIKSLPPSSSSFLHQYDSTTDSEVEEGEECDGIQFDKYLKQEQEQKQEGYTISINDGYYDHYNDISSWDYHAVVRLVNDIFQRLHLAWDFNLDIKHLLWQFSIQLSSSSVSYPSPPPALDSSSPLLSPSLSDLCLPPLDLDYPEYLGIKGPTLELDLAPDPNLDPNQKVPIFGFDPDLNLDILGTSLFCGFDFQY